MNIHVSEPQGSTRRVTGSLYGLDIDITVPATNSQYSDTIAALNQAFASYSEKKIASLQGRRDNGRNETGE